MSNKSQDYLHRPEIPGTISIMSRDNTLHVASLMPEVWEFDHDPDDHFLKKIIMDKQTQMKNRHSYGDIEQRAHLNTIEGALLHSDKYLHHSELNRNIPYDRNEYGLTGLRNQDRIYKKNMPSRSGSGDSNHPRPLRRKSKQSPEKSYKNNQPDELPSLHTGLLTRNYDIFEHRHISNITYLTRQLKELLFLNRLAYLQCEGEQLRKRVMKLQILCRKLKIGLRNSSSSSGLVQIRRKEYIGSPKTKRSLLKSFRIDTQPEKNLLQKISKQKKKINELGTRQSLVTNYYNVIKNRKPMESEQQRNNPIFSQFSRINASEFANHQQLMNYFDILRHHRQILQNSLDQTENHIEKKCSQIMQENKILKQELSLANAHIETFISVPSSRNKSRASYFGKKKEQRNLNSQSKSRKLLFKSPIREENPSQFPNRKQNQFSVTRIRSQRDLGRLDRHSKEGCSMDPEKNEYYLDAQSYKNH